MRTLLTGASGFIGCALAPHLRALGHEVIAWPRADAFDLAKTTTLPPAQWITELRGVDALIHLAGLAHQPHQSRSDETYFRINRDGTLCLAAAARAAGVKRFIFLSSAKVFGEGGDVMYRASSEPAPKDAYALSKWQAEQLLRDQNTGSAMELVMLRPPLVYSMDAKANFAQLIRLARLPIPLPFAGIENRRALIGLDNLIDLIERCLTSPSAAGKTLLCADANPYSLPDMLSTIRRSLEHKPNLFCIPNPALSALKVILGASRSTRLFGNFEMDCRGTYAALNWTPPFSMEQILRGDTRNPVA